MQSLLPFDDLRRLPIATRVPSRVEVESSQTRAPPAAAASAFMSAQYAPAWNVSSSGSCCIQKLERR
ncbi:hypothetical protein AMECASPLE_020276 [Ameca splendens]|uniref:Uncharacterized protein n=1 Tax=Ameca splendens TaxID=208324 RepID=A0ABV0XSC3_9TELE